MSQIDHYATFEGHREPISNLHFIEDANDIKLLSISHDRSFNIWSINNLECLYESPLLGHYSLTSSILYAGTLLSGSVGVGTQKYLGQLGHHYYIANAPIYSIGPKSSLILIIGNCDGKLYFFEIKHEGNETSATKVDELKLNASYLNAKKSLQPEMEQGK